MTSRLMTIGELADAAGCSRRAVRFYVVRGLLSPPLGRGRGGHYSDEHLEQLRRIQELQRAGHSLDAIAAILQGQPAPATPVTPRGSSNGSPRLIASLWTRVRIAEGIELNFDTTRHRPTAEALVAARDTLLALFRNDDRVEPSGPGEN